MRTHLSTKTLISFFASSIDSSAVDRSPPPMKVSLMSSSSVMPSRCGTSMHTSFSMGLMNHISIITLHTLNEVWKAASAALSVTTSCDLACGSHPTMPHTKSMK